MNRSNIHGETCNKIVSWFLQIRTQEFHRKEDIHFHSDRCVVSYKVAFQIELRITKVREACVFRVSQLKRHVGPRVVPSPELPLVDPKGNILAEPIAVIERRVIPRNNEPVVQWLVQWLNPPATATTREDVDFIKKVFPHFNP